MADKKVAPGSGENLPLETPSAAEAVHHLADYVELKALRDRRPVSPSDLVGDIIRAGSSEALLDEDDDLSDAERGEELAQARADDTFSELDRRGIACGGTYPYVLTEGTLTSVSSTSPTYEFMLLLSWFGLQAGSVAVHPDRTFERVATAAAVSYFGTALKFGFPRGDDLPAGFIPALKKMCWELGEGVVNPTASLANVQKDGRLDIVAWQPFPDGSPGKLIAFGQCAAGKTDWEEKLTDLQPLDFQALWLTEPLVVPPVRAFFVPRAIEKARWRRCGTYGGIIFDRFRIAAHSGSLPVEDANAAKAWAQNVSSRIC